MIGTIARLVLVRFLPRRLLPALAAWEFLKLLRGGRGGQADRSTATRPRLTTRRPGRR